MNFLDSSAIVPLLVQEHGSAALVACDHRAQAWRFICLDARPCAAAAREGFQSPD